MFGIPHIYIQKMSRWVRCSYGKRAGFVDAKIGIFLLTSKFFETFLPFLAPKVVSQALWKAIFVLFWIKRYKFIKISYLCSVFGTVPDCWLAAIGKQECRSPRVEAAGREPIYRKGVT